MLAFHLERVREKNAQLTKDKAEASLAFFKLSRMVNRLKNWQADVIDSHRNEQARMLTIQALLPQSVPALIDFDKLGFLFRKDSNLMGELAIGQDNFSSIVDLINTRSVFLRDVIQAKLKSAGIGQDINMPKKDFVRVRRPPAFSSGAI